MHSDLEKLSASENLLAVYFKCMYFIHLFLLSQFQLPHCAALSFHGNRSLKKTETAWHQ